MKNQGDIIIDSVLENTGLTPHEKIILVCLARRMNWQTGKVRMRREVLSERTGLSDWQLRQAIAGIVDKGMVERKRTGRSAIFCFLPPLNREIERVEVMPTTHQKCGPPHIAEDDGCVPCWEDFKDEEDRKRAAVGCDMTSEQWAALAEMTKCLHIQDIYSGKVKRLPWVKGASVRPGNPEVCLGADPVDLTPDQWARHEEMAALLMGTEEQKAVA